MFFLFFLIFLQPEPTSLVVNIKINIETLVAQVVMYLVFIVSAPGILYNVIKGTKPSNTKIVFVVINLVEGELKIINR